jgi:ATP-dependent helicase/nuclease subunit B
MRQSLGLSVPERKLGLSAHDVAQLACAPRVVLTRAQKVDNAPTVPSRWLLRLETVLKGAGAERHLRADGRLAAWARALDEPQEYRPVASPAPKPPREARPTRLSVTQIETLMRDPYAIYARKVLRLDVLKPLDADPGAPERGEIVHGALEDYVREVQEKGLPANPLARLLEIGKAHFGTWGDRPGVRAFWWPRFEDVARWFVAWEADRRPAIARSIVETKGEMTVRLRPRNVTLSGIADRIDILSADGSLAILDYKTGQAPSRKQVNSGLSPQLVLEAWMAEAGAFEGLDPAEASLLLYVKLKGGAKAGEETVIAATRGDVAELLNKTKEKLPSFLAQYDDPDTPYLSRPRPMFENRFGDYDHLARVKEWSTADGAEGGET